MDTAVDLPLDQACLLQHTKVFRDRGRRHVMRLGKLSDRRLPLAGELRQDSAPRRIGERMKDAIEVRRTINHLVNRSDGGVGCQEDSAVGWGDGVTRRRGDAGREVEKVEDTDDDRAIQRTVRGRPGLAYLTQPACLFAVSSAALRARRSFIYTNHPSDLAPS